MQGKKIEQYSDLRMQGKKIATYEYSGRFGKRTMEKKKTYIFTTKC